MNSPEAAYEEALEKIHHALKTSQKELNFDSQNLHALPQEIGQLKSLTSLSLSGNKLKSLPPEIGSLNSLTSLNLSTNSFENFPRGLIQLTNLRELDLRNNKLDSLPSNINFHYLQSLNLGNNVFKTIPPQIFQFKLLNKLSLHSNKLDNVAPEISKLECLTYLDINLNELESIPSAIFKLIRLQHLFLAGNRINAIVPGIKSLIKLLTLDLNSNRINIITSEIGRLKSLQVLYLYKNLLTSLPKEIGELEKLEILELSDNNISNLPPEIKHLNNLRHLSLHNNKLESIPPEIGQLVQATKMDLSKNQISDIPTTIGQLKNLKSLILSSNKIITLPKEIVLLTRLTDLYLNNNLLVNLPKQLSKLVNLKKLLLEDNKLLIPPEILSLVNDPSAIVQYYSTIVSDDSRPLHEAKMILVGQGSVGKTSLVNRLIKNSFNPMEEKTKGITKNRLQINVNSQLYAVNIWDFGGQEIMHSTHQFFLTHRALYLLVFDTRLEEIENRLNYWLKIIRSFGGNSPIILVGNKIDQHPLDLDKRALLENFPQIKAIMPISCLTNSGISALMEKISHEISNLPDINNKIPISWFKVKERLETLSYKYISYEDFDKICEEEEIQGTINKKTVLHFLHDLGTVLSFQDDSSISLQQTQVLRPEWVTNGVYKIINSPTILRNGGIFSWSDLNNTLDESLYPRKIHKAFIVDLMQKFEICFSHDINGEISYLIPDLLSKESIDTGNWDDSLSIQYNYDVLPTSIFSRFLVRRSKEIKAQEFWRNGAVLEKGGNQGLVLLDRFKNTLCIKIRGDKDTRRDYLATLRDELESVNKQIPNLSVKLVIPISNNPNVYVEYENLLALERHGIDKLVPPGMNEVVNVKELLGHYHVDETQGPLLFPNIHLDNELTLSELEFLKEKLDQSAKKEVYLKFLYTYLSGLVISGSLFYFLSNKTPINHVFFIAMVTLIIEYLYFAITQKKISPIAIYQRYLLHVQNEKYQRFGFSLSDYFTLKKEFPQHQKLND